MFNPILTGQQAPKRIVGFQIQIMLEPNPPQNLTSRRRNYRIQQNGTETDRLHGNR